MTFLFHNSRYRVRFARDQADVKACQRLRHLCFFGTGGIDQDQYDPLCRHLMVVDALDQIVATARLFEMQNGAEVANCYTAQSYDLEGLSGLCAPMIELGRFCIAPDVIDADVLRVAWGALTQIVDENAVAMLFGCCSFQGTDPAPYGRVFAQLQSRYLGPDALRPVNRTSWAIPFVDVPAAVTGPMPPLLRTYLGMGGWVSDHAIVDHAMNRLHVFTCLEVASVPAKRAASLRALAKDAALS